jgi:hypothetical protein
MEMEERAIAATKYPEHAALSGETRNLVRNLDPSDHSGTAGGGGVAGSRRDRLNHHLDFIEGKQSRRFAGGTGLCLDEERRSCSHRARSETRRSARLTEF